MNSAKEAWMDYIEEISPKINRVKFTEQEGNNIMVLQDLMNDFY